MDRQKPKQFKPEPYEYHHELILRIETLTNLGVGLGRDNGWVVMVPFALPEELVKVRIWSNHKNYSEADLVKVIESSPYRVEPNCPLFGQCGGCQYQHYTYNQQLEWKRLQVSELLARQAGVSQPVNFPIGSPKQYFYRSKLTPHFNKLRGELPKEIGFQRYDSRRIIDVPHCPIATEAINAALPPEREKIFTGKKKFKRGGTLLLRDTLEGIVTDHNEIVSERVGDLIFQFQAGEFFQNNPFILPEMVNYTLEQAKGDDVRYLVDAYCGVGVFGLSGSKHFEKVSGVEISATAIHWANANAAINNIHNCDFIIGKSEAIFDSITYEGNQTAVIIDPPRKGCDQLFLQQLFRFAPKRVVYVSCDPATQARDTKSFLEAGYQIKAIQPFDLFPQTRHIENVITFVNPNAE